MNKPFYNQFKEVISISNWLKAYDEILDKKEDLFKDNLIKASSSKAEILFKHTIYDIKMNNYNPKPVNIIEIEKDFGDTRKIGIGSDIDKVLQKVIANILLDIYDKDFSKYSYAFRKGKSILNIISELRKRLIQANVVLKYDIKNFFDSINHRILKDKLENKINDKQFLSLIYKFINVDVIDNKVKTKKSIGLVQGSPIANVLSNVYMDSFDKFIEDMIKQYPSADITYIRYCDDFIIGMNTDKICDEVNCKVVTYLKDNLKLSINKNNSRSVYLNRNETLDFVKFKFEKTIDSHKKRLVNVKVDNELIKKRLMESLDFTQNDKYSLKSNFSKYNGLIRFYYKTLEFQEFEKLLKSLKSIINKLEEQELLIYKEYTTFEYKKLNDRLLRLSKANSFVDDIYKTNKNLLDNIDEQNFKVNSTIFIDKFNQYNIEIPQYLTNLEDKIYKLYEELNKKNQGSNGYVKKFKKAMSYQESYFEFCKTVFVDDDKNAILERLNRLEENNFDCELIESVYGVY